MRRRYLPQALLAANADEWSDDDEDEPTDAGGNREEARAQESFRGLHASCGGQDARTPGDDGRGFRFKPSSRSGAAALVVWVASRLSSPRVEA